MDSSLRGYPKYLGYHQVPQGVCGIYVCLDINENVLYVGQSRNIRKRFGSHSRLNAICKNGFKWLVTIPAPKDYLDYEENKWILRLNPMLNIMPVRGRGK